MGRGFELSSGLSTLVPWPFFTIVSSLAYSASNFFALAAGLGPLLLAPPAVELESIETVFKSQFSRAYKKPD